MSFCPDLFLFDRFLDLIFIPSCFLRQGVRPPDYGFLVQIRNPERTVTRILGFLPLTSISEEMEIEILAGESLQGLFDFSFKRNRVLN